MSFKPMLADKVDLDRLSLPVLASPKLDGIRCCVVPGLGPVTRNMKPIRNHFIRGKIAEVCPAGYDGEIITYSAGQRDVYDTVNSKVMSGEGLPDFVFHVFDNFTNPGKQFQERHFSVTPGAHVERVPHELMTTMAELLAYERKCLDDGLEGVMLRDPTSPYKFGRSTMREGWLLKMKRRLDSEATIVGFEEQMHNGNEATLDLLGRTERSSHKENMYPKGTLGALLCTWDETGVDFKIGTGFDDSRRQQIWNEQSTWLGAKVRFSYQGTGVNGRPRFPSYEGRREDL